MDGFFFGTSEQGIDIMCHKGLTIFPKSQCPESAIKLMFFKLLEITN